MTPNTDQAERTYTTREAAGYLDCSRQWVSQLRKSGHLEPIAEQKLEPDGHVRDRAGVADDFAILGLKVRTLPAPSKQGGDLSEVGEDHELLIREVAVVLRCSEQRVRHLVREHRLASRKPGVEYFIRVGTVLDLKLEQSAGPKPRYRFAQSELDKVKGGNGGGMERRGRI